MASPSSAERDIAPRRSIPILDWPVVWGGAAAALFYTALPSLPIQNELAVRYFCGHPIEYATTVLFFVGIALLAKKALGLNRERRAVADAHSRDARRAGPGELLATLPRSLRHTAMAERLRDAAEHLDEPNQATGLAEHLKYVAELAAERLHGSYALVRTVTWAIPILGFLGTVQGITVAIANVNPEQLNNSLGGVTGGLAVAFDTTALSLFLSLLLVFTAFAVERAEQALLDRIEQFALKRLAPLQTATLGSPLLQAETQAAAELLTRTDALIRSQTDLWTQSLAAMRERWTATLGTQHDELRAALSAGMTQTLDEHAQSLHETRGELLAAVDACTGRFEATLANAAASLAGDLRAWRDELRKVHLATVEQTAALGQQSELLVRMADGSRELGSLETRLSDNLEALRATETLQDAVHSLTAAAHLLSARSRTRDAA